MATIAYINIGMSSSLYAGLELSSRLREAGHDVTFISHADIQSEVEDQGFPFVRLARAAALRRQARALDRPWRGPLHRLPLRCLRWIRQRHEIHLASIRNDEIQTSVEDLHPDLLLIDIEMHFAIMATARLQIPTLLTMVWFTIFQRPGLPPMHTSLMPDRRWTRRWVIRMAWLRLHIGRIALAARQLFTFAFLRVRLRPVDYATVYGPELRLLARSHAFSLTRETDRFQWLLPHSYRHLPVLSFTAWEMEFPHAPHPLVHYAGPMANPDRIEARCDAESRMKWERFKRERSAARPLVYGSLGTFWAADQAFLRKVLSVFARRPQWDLVLGLGGRITAEALAPVPPNALLLDWAPQVDVLRIADCAITHGGISTINECVLSQTPMVVCSTRHGDQDGCAARVAFHGLGVMADKDRDRPEQLEQHIAHVLNNPEMVANLAKMCRTCEQYRKDNVAVGVVEGLLSGPATPVSDAG